MMGRSLRYFLPLAVFFIFTGFLYKGLSLKPSEIPSPLIGKLAPVFELPTLHDSNTTFSTEQMKGKVWLFNVWASWCPSCRVEHPAFIELAKRNIVTIVGLSYKDERKDGQQWLRAHGGDPYTHIAFDYEGRVAIDWGVYGAPETFLVDKNGIIQYKHIGPVTYRDLEEIIIPKIKELQG
ncbi:Cytochrome c-type biogenesis protein CcmG/DsbE, thiol:disulfide oxidoreductase [hydrothermal vent metagenome]|uniref:Cytochrome c-type biogenesis protein CcmG/DsbE, thiol:disulfide oxidoreductase n=1 Tax=hydrothermal vent metagenome TaxID=652676 RepID=A0A3B0ZFQ0_9ZZZZ